MSIADMTVAQHTLQHRLNDIPDGTISHIRMGYTLLPKLNAQQLEDVVEYVISNISKKARYDPDIGAEISGIDKNIVGDMLSAIAITVGSIFDISVTKDDFFKVAPDSLISAEVRPVVDQVLTQAIAQRDKIKADVDTSKIANAILPSFKFLEYSVEVRLVFDEQDEVKDKVPLGIFYIATDIDDEITFQASISDLDDLICKLRKARDQISKAII